MLIRTVLALSLLAPAAAPQAVDQARVDAAIKKGVEYLKTSIQRAGAGQFGTREIVLLAMVHGGVPRNDPDFKRVFEPMFDEDLQSTYRVALQAMVLEEVDRVRYQKRLWQCAQFLVDNQCGNGQWSYGEHTMLGEPPASKDVATGGGPKPGEVVIFGESGPDSKPAVRQKIPVKRQREGPPSGDNSNSQYAALGLRACHDAGIVLPRDVAQRAAHWWRESQCGTDPGSGGRGTPTGGNIPAAPPRGWSYGQGGNAYGSMTAGAAGALTICDYILGSEWKRDENVHSGLHWLREHFAVNENPQHGAQWHYYYLYGLERAGMLYGTEKLGSHEWYPEGVKFLLEEQKDNGSWGDRGGGQLVETCFAILFLRRATRPLVETTNPFRKKP
jgi:hypothetical protein